MEEIAKMDLQNGPDEIWQRKAWNGRLYRLHSLDCILFRGLFCGELSGMERNEIE